MLPESMSYLSSLSHLSSFDGFFIDFSRRDQHSRPPINRLGDSVYRLPSFLFAPTALKRFCERHENPHRIQSSHQFLAAYNPENEAMKKVKSYWLKTRKYEEDPEGREQIGLRYPEEIVRLGNLIWKNHCINNSEDRVNADYYRRERVDVEPPPEFVNLTDYVRIEPNDIFPHVFAKSVSVLVDGYKTNGTEWTLNESDLRLIQEHRPEKVEYLKKILWHRHLSLQEKREEEAQRVANEWNETKETIKKSLVCIATLVSAVAAITFASLGMALTQPLLSISAYIFLFTTIVIPTIYFKTSSA